jgi:uncharacterized protein YciI
MELLPAVGWVCADCKTMARSLCAKLRSSISELADKYNELQTEMSQLRQQMKTIVRSDQNAGLVEHQQQSQQSTDDINTVVYRAVKDISRRGQNVIITGLPESDVVTDRESFLQLCVSYLSVKPFVDDSCCRRVGRGSPRRLLVRLGSEAVAAELLSAAPKLRRADPYTAAHVYINADLAPPEAKAAYEARKKRREHILHVGEVENPAAATVDQEEPSSRPESARAIGDIVRETSESDIIDASGRFNADKGGSTVTQAVHAGSAADAKLVPTSDNPVTNKSTGHVASANGSDTPPFQ